jgi:hypothetical protein
MTWPASDVVTTNVDAGTDSPATARIDIFDLFTKFNLLRNHVSSFMQTLLARTTAAVARTDLGLGSTDSPTFAGLNGGPLAGFRNRIINGSFEIDQRNSGAAQTFTATVLDYCVDRWWAITQGSNAVTGQRVSGSAQSRYRYRFTGAAGCSNIAFGQRILASNSYDLNSKVVTLSVDLSNSLLTTVSYVINYANGADNFSGTTPITSGSFTVSSTLTRYYIQVTVPAAAITGIEVYFMVGSQISGTWTIGDVQLALGAANEPLIERRPIEFEKALCQHYYRSSIVYKILGLVQTGIGFGGRVQFLPMRIIPTISSIADGSSGSISARTFSAVTNDSVEVTCTGTGALGGVIIDTSFAVSAEV